MSLPELPPEQAAEAERLYQALRAASDAELRQIAHLLASKPDDQLLGHTEFEVRDLVHKIGATALETALQERKGGATGAPQWAARTAVSRPGSSSTAPRRS